MTGRLLPTLLAMTALALPAAATAQTSDYGDPPPLQTNTTTTTPPPTTPKPTPTAPPKPTSTVKAEDGGGSNSVPPIGTPTGTPPTTLAYTGSEVWMVGLLGLLALAGGVALMRTSRRA